MIATPISSALGAIQITKANVADLTTVMTILTEAAARLCAQGIQQWSSPPPPALWRLMERELAAGHVYLVTLTDTASVIGLFRLRRKDRYWPTTEAAGYVHTLAITDRACGYGIGQRMLAWIGDHLRNECCRYLRLDCIASNARLRRYYEEQGFLYRGEVVDGDYTLALYQLSLSVIINKGDSSHGHLSP
jgi:GNAT superfamily N-acetyltransferase